MSPPGQIVDQHHLNTASMSSVTSRFSSLSSASGKCFQPPKPTYNSPKLVGEPLRALSSTQELPKTVHPFAAPSSSAQKCPVNELEQSCSQLTRSSRSHAEAVRSYTSDLSTLRNDLKIAPSSRDDVATDQLGSILPHVPEQGSSGCRGSVTVDPQQLDPPWCPPLDDFLSSSNPFKSQFEDSDDEEKPDAASRSLSGMPHRARLAAIGTASRLFKGRRHSRGGSSTHMLSQDLPAPLKLDRRASKQHETSSTRPSTSDGLSPLPRQAVFGHRPSPSELSFLSKPETACSFVPGDRDLILGLQGNVFKSRTKPIEKKVIQPLSSARPSAHCRHPERANAVGIVADGRTHWMDPPPYCASEGPGRPESESRQASQASSTLHSDPVRGPMQMFAVSEAGYERPPVQASRPLHAKARALETIIDPPLDTPSDDNSLSSCVRVVHPAILNPPSKRILKAQRLPPQKPPPRSSPPPPPNKVASFEPLSSSGSARSSFEGGSPASASVAGLCRLRLSGGSPLIAQGASVPAGEADIAPLTSPEAHAPLEEQRQHLAATPQLDCQVVLDVGGVNFVTLTSTLQGAPGDQPRLIQGLNWTDGGPERLLINDSRSARCKRVAVPQRVACGPAESDECKQDTQSHGLNTAELEISKPRTVFGLGNEPKVWQSRKSSIASTSGGVSQTASETSTRRTSDVSAASSWSSGVLDIDHVCSKEVKGQDEATLDDVAHIREPDDIAQVQEQVGATCCELNSGALTSSRLCSPPSFPPERSAPCANGADASKSSSCPSRYLFVDRNGDVYRDVLDILRARKLPYRLQAASLVGASSDVEDRSSLTVLKLQLRCRLHEIKDEAAWLGYFSIVKLCEHELLSL